MSHRDCPREFALLAAGGVLVTYACGAQVAFDDETAVDVDVLEARLPRAHHHYLHHAKAKSA